MKRITLNALIGTCLLALSALAFAAGDAKPAENGYMQQRVVYHINDIDSANSALRNVKNHLNALGDQNAEIIVVTHSSGALALVDGSEDAKGNHFADTVQKLANRGVKFQICENTIRGKKIDRSKINLIEIKYPA